MHMAVKKNTVKDLDLQTFVDGLCFNVCFNIKKTETLERTRMKPF